MNIVKPKINRQYHPTYEQWVRIEGYTEFDPNDDFMYSTMELIDFNKCKVHLKGGKRIAFDGLSEKQYVHVCNGGYYEDAPQINDTDRI